MKKKGLIIAGIILIILAIAFVIYFKFSQSASFSITPDYPIKINLVPGAEAKTSIKIKVRKANPQVFSGVQKATNLVDTLKK